MMRYENGLALVALPLCWCVYVCVFIRNEASNPAVSFICIDRVLPGSVAFVFNVESV